MSSLLQFLNAVGRLKHLKRKGWVLRDVPEPECVGSHMYRMAIMCMLTDKEEPVDLPKCIKLALIHDLAEAIVGDITPVCGVSSEDKYQREEAAMATFKTLLGDPFGQELYDLWIEFEKGETEESKLVKDLDRADLLLQAYEYEKDKGLDLSDFFERKDGHQIKSTKWKALEEEIRELRSVTRADTK